MTGIDTMQHKRCKLSHEVVRCPPDMDVRVGGDGDVSGRPLIQALRKEVLYKLSIRRKGDGFDWSLEVEMVQDHCSLKIHEQGSAICNTCGRHYMWRDIDLPSSITSRICASGLRAIAAMFLRVSKGRVRDLLLCWSITTR